MRFDYAVLAGLVGVILAGPALSVERTVPPSEAALRYSFSPVVKRVSPAVVNVYASRTVKQRPSPFMDDPFFRQFFGGGGQGAAPRTRVQQSLGSGVIVDASGVVVTNYHVIANADEVKVALSDRREMAADIILKDERMDLAILKLKGDGPFPVVPFADSDALEVGDLVLAVGDPFGVGQTVTSGIVSALARTQVGASDYQFFIQTDAAINPGNSGGALVDMDGRLVGINSAIYSRTGGSIGIGFAIPSNMVRVVTKSALTGGKVLLPWIGADFQQVTQELAEGLGIDRPRGALVTDVVPAGPSAAAGLKAGDVVVSVDGVEIDDSNALNYRLATKGVGGNATLGIIRAGAERSLTMALVAAPETPPRDERTIQDDSPFSGMQVVNLSPAVIDEVGYKGRRSNGVLIEAVSDMSASVGFQPGDVIVEINGVAIDSTKNLAAITGEGARSWSMTIERGGRLIRSRIGG